ncbi:MAG: dihydroorotase [Candidatus Nomurabacteria bacterium]|nr:MAG: dihydroorotase [Candidatus Nomurabacteria bacterium]
MKTEITITKPDDWHLHVRDGSAIQTVLPYSARQFARAIIMPNLKPPIVNVQMALDYRQRIVRTTPVGLSFDPLMTIYLTDDTTPKDIMEAAKSPCILGAKLYPAGVTTNSGDGVTDIWRRHEVFEAMQECELPLLLHGESLVDKHGNELDIFDREPYFIENVLSELVDEYEGLKIVLEHITTREAVDFVMSSREGIAATITAHHLLENRNAIFRGGIQPHNYCLPILKSEEDREALVGTAISGNPKFFLGTDSAPHARSMKENACGCAGIFTAHAALELYAEAFEQAGALDKLESFASFHGADFYGLPRNTDTITLRKETWQIPKSIPYTQGNVLIPFRAGKNMSWKLVA